MERNLFYIVTCTSFKKGHSDRKPKLVAIFLSLDEAEEWARMKNTSVSYYYIVSGCSLETMMKMKNQIDRQDWQPDASGGNVN